MPTEQEKRTKKTNRGFAIYAEFSDKNGQEVRVQQSSQIEPRVWIFVEPTEHRGTISAGAHLDRRQAKKVIKALSGWLWHQFREVVR